MRAKLILAPLLLGTMLLGAAAPGMASDFTYEECVAYYLYTGLSCTYDPSVAYGLDPNASAGDDWSYNTRAPLDAPVGGDGSGSSYDSDGDISWTSP